MFYGNKDKDIIFKDTLDKLANDHNWLSIYYIIEPQLIDSDILKKHVSDLYNCFYYISGPLKMVQIMKEMGHFPMSENPERFLGIIRPVLTRLATAP